MLFVCFWETHGSEHISMERKCGGDWILHCCACSLFLSCRKWFQMKGIKVDSYWKNQSCCISKGIPLVFRSLFSISLHSSGELNHSLHARYWPNGFLTEIVLLSSASVSQTLARVLLTFLLL